MSDLTNTVQGSGVGRPILFSGPMVRALLAGTKTQTRRILKPQPNMLNGGKPLNNGRGSYSIEGGWKRYPISQGDTLWVRESWDFIPLDEPKPEGSGRAEIVYWADADRREFDVPAGFDPMIYGQERFRPSIHMPRWTSRLTLTVTDVRVQRLQDCSGEDAIAEGISIGKPLPEVPSSKGDIYHDGVTDPIDGWTRDPVEAYRTLWEHINGAGSWAANPWVAAYTFTVEHQNIDAALKAVSP